MTSDKLLGVYDANKDGKLTRNEMPGRIGDRFDMIDQNHDGAVTKQELESLIKLMRTFGGGRD